VDLPYPQSTTSYYSPQRTGYAIILEIHVVEIEVVSVRPQLLERELCVLACGRIILEELVKVNCALRSDENRSCRVAPHVREDSSSHARTGAAHEIVNIDVFGARSQEVARRHLRLPPKGLCDVLLLRDPELGRYDAALVVCAHQDTEDEIEDEPEGEKDFLETTR